MGKLKRFKQAGAASASSSPLARYGAYALLALLAVAVAAGAASLFFSSNPATGGAIGTVHWHATPRITVCGNPRPLPSTPSGHLGTPLLHVHDDGRAHIEGFVRSPREITLGRFFQAIGVPFSSTRLMEKENGDPCPDGKPGKVSMTVNGAPSTAFERYVLRDGDVIELRFA